MGIMWTAVINEGGKRRVVIDHDSLGNKWAIAGVMVGNQIRVPEDFECELTFAQRRSFSRLMNEAKNSGLRFTVFLVDLEAMRRGDANPFKADADLVECLNIIQLDHNQNPYIQTVWRVNVPSHAKLDSAAQRATDILRNNVEMEVISKRIEEAQALPEPPLTW